MNRVTLKNSEARPDELLEAEIFGNLKGVLCLVEHLDTVQGKYPDFTPHMAMADQIKGPIEEPDFVWINLSFGFLFPSQ